MSGLLFLESDDFTLQRGTKGNILCTAIPGFSLILFYSTQCPHCKDLIPIFRKLPGSIGGCQFGMLNVTTNKNCIRLSKDTVAPISYVPLIILYVSGRPFMKFNGQIHSTIELQKFVIEVAQKVEKKQKFSKEQNNNTQEIVRGKVPEFSLGIPLYGCEDGVCYLEFQEAYEKIQQANQQQRR